MKPLFLLKHITLYPLLKRYARIKDIPIHERQFRPLRVNFRLWGVWYVPQGPEGLLLKNGESLRIHTMHANNGEVVIGMHDLEAAAGTPYAEAWRESYSAKINERLSLSL